MRKRRPWVSHELAQSKEFRARPELAFGYLDEAFKVALDEDDPAFALIALSGVVKALGTTRVAKQAGLQRESVHRMLSKSGNPEWKSLSRLLRALGLRIKLVPAKTKTPVRA